MRGRNKKRKKERVWREEAREGSWEAKGGWWVSLSHPVPCCGDMSFSSIHREKGRQRERET